LQALADPKPQVRTAAADALDLDDAMNDLNRSTNRLRRQFDQTDKWIETRNQMERVMDDARRVNQIMIRGKYGTQAERYWTALRASINDLARCYGLYPMSAVAMPLPLPFIWPISKMGASA